MRDLAVLFVHLIATVARLLGRGGARAVVAESLLLKHQLLILNRSRARAPNLRPIDRVIAGLCTGLMRPSRLLRSAIVLKPVDNHGVPPRIGEAQVSTSVLARQRREAGTQRACPRADHRHRRDEAQEPEIWLPADRPTARFYVRRRDRQGCRAPCAVCKRATSGHGEERCNAGSPRRRVPSSLNTGRLRPIDPLMEVVCDKA